MMRMNEKDRYHLLLGRFITAFASAETSLRWITLKLAHQADEEPTKKLDRRPATELARALLKDRSSDPDDDMRDIYHFIVISEFRTDLLHHAAIQSDDRFTIHKRMFEPGSSIHHTSYALEDIINATNDLLLINMSFSGRFYRACDMSLDAIEMRVPDMGKHLRIAEQLSRRPYSYVPAGK